MNESHPDQFEPPELTPDEIQARVLYRDGLMLVIDKPPGLPVHRGPKGGPNLEASFDALRYGLPRPPVLAHRLDRDTSGCLVLGRHRKATATLGLLFKHSRISKTYWAIVEGGPTEHQGSIDLPIGKLNAERGWWQKIDRESGLPSLTKWRVMGRSGVLPAAATTTSATSAPIRDATASGSPPPCGEGSGVGVHSGSLTSGRPHPNPLPQAGEGVRPAGGEADNLSRKPGAILGAPPPTQLTWLALEPITGRTHQLRVHCAAMGWPILGDNIYGNGLRFGEPRLHLHAREIVIPLSRNKPPVVVTAPPPTHMHPRLSACGWTAD
ncbi:RNA pseudouridine synthase [Rhodopseudomonas palustris]|uniref:RluA family pseudouridine synthase n=1 Tax=Rhodopseudomonas palustris TaxID=1076 RepID=UPI0022F0D845|nr:RNA pseudouridine synthase [Rhodopseudomonas palustris]WBU30114.1 RNA pseudouridine synthase [Rhodopseudomonas palustris]